MLTLYFPLKADTLANRMPPNAYTPSSVLPELDAAVGLAAAALAGAFFF